MPGVSVIASQEREVSSSILLRAYVHRNLLVKYLDKKHYLTSTGHTHYFLPVL
jgi:hypothetical protein